MKQVLVLIFVLAIMSPTGALARDVYPQDVKHIFLEKYDNQDRYDVVVALNSGPVHEFGGVSYTTGRSDFYESVAEKINESRFFNAFDSYDVIDLIYNDVDISYSNGDVKDLSVTVIDQKTMQVNVDLTIGQDFDFIIDLGETQYTGPQELAELIARNINLRENFVSNLSATDILEYQDEFEGAEYYAPRIQSLIVEYDPEDETFLSEVVFNNGDIRLIATIFKNTKRQVLFDVAETINLLYEEYEENNLTVEDFEEVGIEWRNLPLMIDDIAQISAIKKDGNFVYIAVETNGEYRPVRTLYLEGRFSKEMEVREEVAIMIADTLEPNPVFSPDFNIVEIDNVMRIGASSEAASILEEYENADLITEPEISSERSLLDPEEGTLSSVGGKATEEGFIDGEELLDENTSNTQDTTSSTQELEAPSEAVSTTDLVSTNTEDDRAIIAMLIALILQYAGENGLTIDLSEFE